MIGDLLAEVNVNLQELSGVVVCAGPGSYTGLRIGLATAKGLCYALDKPLFLHNKLTLLCRQEYYNNSKKYETYVAILSAREKEYFISAHDNNLNCIVAPQHVFEADLNALLCNFKDVLIITDNNKISDIILINNEIQIAKITSINMNEWVRYAFEEYKCNSSVNLSESEPFYLKQVYTHK
jgi:tRNA threonylcarbamoyladenosine biosynthesis protein TsaB